MENQFLKLLCQLMLNKHQAPHSWGFLFGGGLVDFNDGVYSEMGISKRFSDRFHLMAVYKAIEELELKEDFVDILTRNYKKK